MSRRIFHSACLSLVLVAAVNLSIPAAYSATIVVRDARDREVEIANPSRTVAIGGAITEVLFALGLESRIAGVDSTSLFPPAALKEKPNVGYMRQLSPEGVIGLNPTLILATQGAGPKETMQVIEAARIPLVLIPENFSEQGLLDKIALVGHAMGADRGAACLIAAVTDDLAKLRALRGKVTKPARVMFVMSLVNGQAMAAGRNTAADEIIKLAGGLNAIEGYDGYKMINDEAIVDARPDVVLSIQRSKDSLEAEAIYGHPAFALTEVAANKAFISMEGLYLLGFGPRTAAAARDVATKLYPELAEEAGRFEPAAPTANCRQ
jgi:iron complex transport system substrate-binding protein